jgi:putative chitinase
MRFVEFVPKEQVDEGLKDVAAAGLLSLGLLGSPTKAAQSVLPFDIKQQQAQQQQLAQLKKQAIKKPVVARPFNEIEKVLIASAKQSGIKGVELAQFLAQMAHESWDFKKMREVPQGKNYFKRYDKKHAPNTAKILGNVQPGDGERFKGRGFIQLTGRTNYKQASLAIFGDDRLLKKPDQAAQPDIAAKIALWYWNTRVKPNVDNWADTKQVTRKINPALKGLDDRHENFKEYIALLQK